MKTSGKDRHGKDEDSMDELRNLLDSAGDPVLNTVVDDNGAVAEVDVYAGWGTDLADNLSFDVNAIYFVVFCGETAEPGFVTAVAVLRTVCPGAEGAA